MSVVKHENLLGSVEKFKQLWDIHSKMCALSGFEDITPTHYKMEWDDKTDAYVFDNGNGDKLFVFFVNGGCIIKAYWHEFEVNKKAYDGVPAYLLEPLNDVCVEKQDVTWCVWREVKDTEWRGNLPAKDGGFTDFFENSLFLTAERFCEYAEDDWGIELPLAEVKKVYQGAKLDLALIKKINPDIENPDEVLDGLKEVGLA